MSRWEGAAEGWARRAIEFADLALRGRVRPGSDEPAINHPIRVARTVAEARFREPVVLAALFHDLPEQTPITLNEIGCRFDVGAMGIIAECSPLATDPAGRPLPWEDRTRAHLDRLRARARIEVRAVVLADQLDDLRGIGDDLAAGRPTWDGLDVGLRYRESLVSVCDCEHRQVHMLADQCRRQLGRIRVYQAEKSKTSGRAP